jgi:hypothetical protein
MAFQYEKQALQQEARTAEEQSAAEVKAERRRVARESAEIAQRRRERVASVQAGRLPRQELDASELILLESYERKEEAEQRPGFFERLSRRVAGSALGTLVASVITAASAAPTSCGGAYNPFLIRVAAVLGGLGLVVLAVAAAVWLFRHLFL